MALAGNLDFFHLYFFEAVCLLKRKRAAPYEDPAAQLVMGNYDPMMHS